MLSIVWDICPDVSRSVFIFEEPEKCIACDYRALETELAEERCSQESILTHLSFKYLSLTSISGSLALPVYRGDLRSLCSFPKYHWMVR